MVIHRFLDMLFHTVDGNFQSTLKKKPQDPSDFPLTQGAAYYANESDYKTFMQHRVITKKQVSMRCPMRW